MRNLSLAIAGLAAILSTANASMVTITDNYIGGAPTHSSYYGKDIVGEPASFDVSSMSVDLDRNARKLSVSIASGYMDNIGALGTQLGDLFLSTDGWKVTGSAATGYRDDVHTAGEWNYAVVFDNHLATGGKASLYAITDANVKKSWASGIYRENQAVQAQNLSGLAAVGTGTWNVNTATNILSLNVGFGSAFDSATNFAFHWGMTCANDVIEGAATFAAVPEPGVIALILAGLMVAGLAWRRRYAV